MTVRFVPVGRLGAGDFLFTPPGASHRASAVTDARFVLVLVLELPAVPDDR